MIDNEYLNEIRAAKDNKKQVELVLAKCMADAKKNSPSALVAVSVQQLDGKYIEKNVGSGLKRLDALVKESGNEEAAEVLAIIAQNGLHGQPEDHNKAERLFRLAANSKRQKSAQELATYYETGEHFTKDLAESLRWHEVAANLGSLTSKERLGEIYLTGGTGLFGEHIEIDERKGIDLLESATNLGSLAAPKLLAIHHLKKIIYNTQKADQGDKDIITLNNNLKDLEWLCEK